MTYQNGHPLPNPNRTTMAPNDRSRLPAPGRRKKKRSWLWLGLLVGALILAGLTALILVRRQQAQAQLTTTTRTMAVPTVLVVSPKLGDSTVHLVLPGTVEPYVQSNVYAQVTGYLKRWLVDIGAPVTKGELLAEIETPETDQQLQSAQATQGQTQASVDLAQITADRYNLLLHTQAVSQQDVDEKNGDLAVAEANLNAAKANVGRLQKTEGFKEVYSPIDGVLTQRLVDTGDLVNAGTGSSSQKLFQISQTDTLRVYVQVPESYSEEMVPGLQAKLEMASNPNQTISGTLVRTSKSIEPSSLTLLVEVDVDNRDQKLFPGGYAQVHFDLHLAHPPLVLPGNTLIFRAQGTQVGVVDDNDTTHLKDIKIGRDFGTSIEVVDGVTPQDQVILNPSDSITDGQKVRIDTKNQPQSP